MCCAERPFGQQLEQVIRVMDLLTEEAMKIKEKGEVKFQLPKDSTVPASSSTSSSTTLPAAGKDTMVGFDDVLIQTMDIITRQQSGPRQIIPISGMGGIGKTTLARSLYETPYIVQNFDVRAWVTISQEYEIKDIFSYLLIQFGEETKGMDESQLGLKIHKHLFGRKYLIVMDDVWSIDVCDRVQRFFPDNGNGSRIVITTRLSNIASLLGSCGLEMNLLDKQKSWDLLRVKVFGQQECPPGLEEIGREITKNCRGLPLSIVVMAGILAKSNMTPEYWTRVSNEVNSIVSQADDGRCSIILSLSYKNLPIHLKPCFLYMGVFPEDCKIKVNMLVRLWVSEGFLKPTKSKTLEEVAKEYFTDLVDRNLIMVHWRSSRGKITWCKMHDLLGDLCLREAQREQFICVARKKGSNIFGGLPNERRIVIDKFKKEQKDSDHFNNQLGALSVPSIPRSVRFDSGKLLSLRGCKLIRILSSGEEYKYWISPSGEEYELNQIAPNQVNLRYLVLKRRLDFPSSINILWNLQTIYVGTVDNSSNKGPDIWKMKQLRHFSETYGNSDGVHLPEPPPLSIDGGEEDTILKHLQTLKTVVNLPFTQAVIERIPNIKRLKVRFVKLEKGKDYCLSNLQYLLKLESLDINPRSLSIVGIFPHSLKKLVLCGGCKPWEDLSTSIGLLPNLQVLKLRADAFIGEEWNPIEGQFLSLKYLELTLLWDLKVWNAESIHFPVLEKLVLWDTKNLEEIPQGIGEIPTLRSIELKESSDSIVRSAIDILDEQESQGNYDIKIEVWLERFSTQKLETRDNLIVHDH